MGMIDLGNINQRTRPAKKSREEKEKERKERNKIIVNKQITEKPVVDRKKEEDNLLKTQVAKLTGPTVLGKINLPEERKEQGEQSGNRKKRRKRIIKENDKVTVERKPGEKPKGNFVVNKQVPKIGRASCRERV